MNRFTYVMLVTVLTITGFTMYTHHDLGSVTISFADFTFTTNLLVFGAAALSALFVILLIIRFIQLLKNFFNYLFGQRTNRLKNKAQSALNRGLLEYIEGKYAQSEKTLLGYIQYSDNPFLAYITAAKAAHYTGAPDRRDSHLRHALESSPEAGIAIGITRAQLQLDSEQNEQALATLQQLNQQSPGHFYILQSLASTCHKLEDWSALASLIPELNKHGQLSAEAIQAYEIAIFRGQIKQLSLTGDFSRLHDYWLHTDKQLKKLPVVIEFYARCLIETDSYGEAEKTLRSYLDTNWCESTMELYAELDVVIDNKSLEIVESWLKEHPQNAHLLLALGKFCLNLSLWGKARNYFEASLAIKPLPETYLKLARLLEEHMHETEAAAEYYRQGLHLLVGNYNESVLDIPPLQSVTTEPEAPRLAIVKP